MNPSKEVLDQKLAELEGNLDISDIDVSSILRGLRKDDLEGEPCQEWIYEFMAFSFAEKVENGWGTYFGPIMTWRTDDGEIVEHPSIQAVDKNTIDYWNQRADSTRNPILKARYLGLIFDFHKLILNENPHYSIAIEYCNALLSAPRKKADYFAIEVVPRLERALFVATSFKNATLIESAKKAVIESERLIAEDSKPGLWGFSFDLLVGKKNINLSKEEEEEIINDLEARLERLKDSDPWLCENAAERLARYYRSKGLEADCSRVIRTLGATFENSVKKATPIQASSQLEHMYHIYRQFNLITEAEQLSRHIRELGPEVIESMIEATHTMEISQEELDAYLEKILDGEITSVLTRIAIQYIPRRGEVVNQLNDLAKHAPLSFLFKKQLTDHQGRVVAEVGSLENDLDGNIAYQISQNISLSGMFLGTVLDKAVEKFSLNTEVIITYLFNSPIFKPNQNRLLTKGIQAYFEKDDVVAIHLLVPQIEAGLRNLVEMSGGVVLKPRSGGGFHFKTLDEILRSEQVSTALGEDTALYFRVVLTDQRGWNVRNDVCHGIFQIAQFSKGITDRLIHILLVLAQLRLTTEA